MIKTTETDSLLTVREVAEKLRVHEMTIKRWIHDGAMDAIRLPAGVGQRARYRIKASTVTAIVSEEK